jgi:hypothetical protein
MLGSIVRVVNKVPTETAVARFACGVGANAPDSFPNADTSRRGRLKL